MVVGRIFGLHESEKVPMGVLVDGLGGLGSVAVDGEMVPYPGDDGSGKEHVLEVDAVLPGCAAQHNGLVLRDEIVTDRAEVGKRACDDLSGAPVEGHMEQLGAVGGGEDQRPV